MRTAHPRPWWLALLLASAVSACVHPGLPPSLCEHPAPVGGHADPAAPGVIMIIRDDADLYALAARLKQTYNIDVSVVPSQHQFMLRSITDTVVTHLRCEPDIQSIVYNQVLKHVTL